MEVDGHLRKLREKLRQDGRNMEHTKGDWRGKAYATTRYRRLSNDLVFSSFAFRKNMSGAVVELAPGFSHRKAARAAIEQARSEFLFDPADKGARLDDLRKDR